MASEHDAHSSPVELDLGSLAALSSFLHIVYDSRRLILRVTGIITAITIVVSLILPKSYKSVSVLIPDTDESKLMGMAGLSDLASMVGLNIGSSDPEKLYPDVLQSESVLRDVIYAKYKTEKYDSLVDLIQYWKIDEDTPILDFEAALKKLRNDIDVGYDRATNIVTVTLWMPEPQLAADVLTNIVVELDKFFRTKRITNATEQRLWIETRLVQVKKDLMRSEDTLQQFRKANRAIMSSPELQMEEGRLSREVDINSTEYIELKRQYEIIKIQEIKNTPIINVMDAARAPGKKDKPKRTIMVLAAFFLSIIGTILYVYVDHEYGQTIRAFVGDFFPAGVIPWRRKRRNETAPPQST